MTNNKPILITTGEPAGIGMDIVLDLANNGFFSCLKAPIIVTGCNQSLDERNTLLSYQGSWHLIDSIDDITSSINSNLAVDFYLLDIPTEVKVIAGTINPANAKMVMQQLATAHELALSGQISGIVTAPIQKSALIDAGLTLPDGTMFSGHTEYFMQMSKCQKVVMMLANSKLKVALVTTHLPLSQVASAITQDEVQQTVKIVIDSLCSQFCIDTPKILVCGLNPHAGESGHLGMEEIEIIDPVLQSFINEGHDISLSMPADTLFTEKYLSNCDATIAMYHDQGLPVLKSHGFGDSVNITLGLPYIRTSVDHGTALNIAGSGNASSDSLKQALNMLVKMCPTSDLIFPDIQTINFHAPWLSHVAGEVRRRDVYESNEPLFIRLNQLVSNLYPQGLQTGQGKPLTFIAQSVLDAINLNEPMAYETLIAETGQIPTRDNLHDLFNAWVWLTFPKTKAMLNRHQAEQIAQDGVSGSRGRVRDAITVLDENGAVFITCDNNIAEALKNFDWHHCLVTPREHWLNPLDELQNQSSTTMVMLCGHALMEQLIEPRKPLCAHSYVLHVNPDFFELPLVHQVSTVDKMLAAEIDTWLQQEDVTPRQLSPLPILGVPYFWKENSNPDFYQDTYVFRSGRRKKS